MTTKTLKFKGWRVVLDSSEIVADDPGAGTPAMVYAPSGKSGTYHCVRDTGEIDCGSEEVPADVCNWLNDIDSQVDDFMEAHS